MTSVADRHPRLMRSLSHAQETAQTLWRQSPSWPREDSRNPCLRALALCDHVLSQAHLPLPSGILTMENMEPSVLRDARAVLARVRRLRKGAA